jgi:hypothetical protein
MEEQWLKTDNIYQLGSNVALVYHLKIFSCVQTDIFQAPQNTTKTWRQKRRDKHAIKLKDNDEP